MNNDGCSTQPTEKESSHMELAGKTIWITGASSGVGEGMAKVFHRAGANVILSALNRDELENAAAKMTEGAGTIHLVPFDITDRAGREAAASEVLEKFDQLDVLVNNAGISQRSLAKDTDLEVDRRIMEVDFFGPIALSKLVLPRFIEQQAGHFVVTSSVAGKHAVPFRTAYCAAKHALHGFFDTLRVEHYEDNIAVTMLVIAGIPSNIAKHALTANGTEFGRRDMSGKLKILPEECGERVMRAMIEREQETMICIEPTLEAARLAVEDPVAFTKRLVGVMKWMGNQ
jgi:short-subunit dehydrogenase